MGLVVAVLSLATIPVAILVSTLRDPTMHRRSRFAQRFAGLVLCMALPWMVDLVAAPSEQAAVTLLWLGLAWVFLLIALAPQWLFRRPGSDPGPSDEGGRGPEDDPPPPDRPTGGIPLPDAQQPASRWRGPHTPPRPAHRRRPARERERRPSRLLPFRHRPSVGESFPFVA